MTSCKFLFVQNTIFIMLRGICTIYIYQDNQLVIYKNSLVERIGFFFTKLPLPCNITIIRTVVNLRNFNISLIAISSFAVRGPPPPNHKFYNIVTKYYLFHRCCKDILKEMITRCFEKAFWKTRDQSPAPSSCVLSNHHIRYNFVIIIIIILLLIIEL